MLATGRLGPGSEIFEGKRQKIVESRGLCIKNRHCEWVKCGGLEGLTMVHGGSVFYGKHSMVNTI